MFSLGKREAEKAGYDFGWWLGEMISRVLLLKAGWWLFGLEEWCGLGLPWLVAVFFALMRPAPNKANMPNVTRLLVRGEPFNGRIPIDKKAWNSP